MSLSGAVALPGPELPETLAPALQNELDGTPWMYPWQLTPTIQVPLLGANLDPVHRTRLDLIEPVARAALDRAGPGASAIDLACNEGWFSHRLLEWGAQRVLGVDVRPHNIQRATLLRDHYGIGPERLEFVTADALELDTEALGRFDVVLLLGLIYHLERPLDALRMARRLSRRVCVIETQLTRQNRPIVYGYGSPNVYLQAEASFAAWFENQPENPLASSEGVMSLVPNRAALVSMARWAGFGPVESLSAQAHHDVQYVVGDRAIIAASVPGEPATRPREPDGPLTGLPLPPRNLRRRVGCLEEPGDPGAAYEALGRRWKELIVERLPAHWSWGGKRVLDFGAGAGRIIRHFQTEAPGAEFWACDIDQPSITWLEHHLSPPFRPFVVSEQPGLPHAESYFDLIWVASVFTHLTDHWAGWLLELHRVLRPGGTMIVSFLGPDMGAVYLPLAWEEDRTGMLVINKGAPWELGGPTVFHSQWWLRAHWGRAFEFLRVDTDVTDHDLLTLRKRPALLTVPELEQPEPGEPREIEALRHNIEQLHAIDRTRW
jgi:2-polyprenyl-3-methyl-5-hydroxy-6-metoxy-1,4-benzoquinol methylase